MMWRYISRRAAWGEGEEEGNKKNPLVAARAEECVRACHYGDDRPESAGKVDSSNMAVRWLATRHDENAIAHDDGRTRVARNYALCWHEYARAIDERAGGVAIVRSLSADARLPENVAEATFRRTSRCNGDVQLPRARASLSWRRRARAPTAHAAIHLHNAVADARAARFFARSVARFRTESVATPRC